MAEEEDTFKQTNLNSVRRLKERGHYDKTTVYDVVDEGFLAHVGFIDDSASDKTQSQPIVVPMLYGREGDSIFLHGSSAARVLKRLRTGIPVCINITLVDGIVMARSLFNHSMNYRSATVFGTAKLIENENDRIRALRVISEHLMKGRWDDAREPNEDEMMQTHVLEVKISSASAKIREGPPGDEDFDLADKKLVQNVWAGVLPIKTITESPIPDAHVPADLKPPQYLASFNIQDRNR
eukprot:TRINITY_DN5952_c0_g1_i2.p1 TRINITY_DN5952_c0_g1~~TRINITY_DN5952_c0_g1_i2.p1  ORF type:complete len:238 (+),score=29.47 TRINITY_DN5952_c0_g1_i2:29-742(+)